MKRSPTQLAPGEQVVTYRVTSLRQALRSKRVAEALRVLTKNPTSSFSTWLADNPPHVRVAIAQIGKRIVAWAALKRLLKEDKSSFRQHAVVGWFVHPDWRECGIARGLSDHLFRLKTPPLIVYGQPCDERVTRLLELYGYEKTQEGVPKASYAVFEKKSKKERQTEESNT